MVGRKPLLAGSPLPPAPGVLVHNRWYGARLLSTTLSDALNDPDNTVVYVFHGNRADFSR